MQSTIETAGTGDLRIGGAYAGAGRNLAQLHSTLWTNPGGRDVLRHALRGDALPSFVQIAIDGDDVNLFGPTLRGFLVAQGSDGATLPGATLRRVGGPQIPFTASDGPRHGFALATATLPKTQDRRFFRFTLACDFAGAPEPEERTFLLPRSHA